MTIQEFKQNFCLKIKTQNTGVTLTIITEAIRRVDNKVVDGVKTTIDIHETHDWIVDSNSLVSVTPWSWEQYIEETKRFQLDYFVQRANIENWYPLDKQTNPDLTDLYC
jgi:hypothetical protein